MRPRALLIIAALALFAGCGTTGGDTVAKDEDTTTSTTEAEKKDPPTTEGSDDTEPDDPSTGDDEFEQVLPVVDDLPAGFEETEVPERETDPTTYEPSPGCEAMAEWFGRRGDEDEILAQRSFETGEGSQFNVKIRAATDDLRALLDGMGKELELCKLVRVTSVDYAANANMAPGPLDLGDAGFVVDMHVVPDDMEGFPPTGITNIAVLHGDVIFSIQMTDGLTDLGERITRDPMVARDIATQMAEKLDELPGD
jgi:hypothetical protein